jgi:hypothetical protein
MQRDSEHKIDRTVLVLMYVGTYFAIVVLFGLAMSRGDASMMGNELLMICAMLPMGLTFFFGGKSIVLGILAYAVLLTVITMGMINRSLRTYLLFVVIMVLNAGGCCIGLNTAGH